MHVPTRPGVLVMATLVLYTSACTAPPVTPSATPPPPVLGEARSPRQAHIVEPRVAPGVFPRTVHDVTGDIVIPHTPVRIHTLSVGFDEITVQLVDPSRIAAIGTVTANPDYSNVTDIASRIPLKIGRDAEQILSAAPDLVVASPFSDPNLVQALRATGVPVVVADLVSSMDGQADNVRFLAYLYGEEARGEVVAQDIQAHIARLNALSERHPREEWPRALVLSPGHPLNAAGSGTTEDGVLTLAGLRNAAAEAGVVGNRDISLEVLPEMQPDLVIVTEANPDKPTLLPTLPSTLTTSRVVVVKTSLLNTLSQWNLVGADQLHSAAYPNDPRD